MNLMCFALLHLTGHRKSTDCVILNGSIRTQTFDKPGAQIRDPK